ncbi:MAG TPA: hypothetical protein VLM90_06050, partial [Candidatus Deferrimicrobium sp.]|nr:hypothetical protein [Candidatus Deferrimicrobium sp.]
MIYSLLFLGIQQRGKEDLFDSRQFLRQAFGAGILEEHFKHFSVLFHAEGKRVVTEGCRLLRSIVVFKVEIAGAAETAFFIGCQFALAKDSEELAGKPVMLIQQAALRDDDVIGRHDARLLEKRFDRLSPAVGKQFSQARIAFQGGAAVAIDVVDALQAFIVARREAISGVDLTLVEHDVEGLRGSKPSQR